MKTMITRVCDIKIIVSQKIRKIIVQTEWEQSEGMRYNGESIYVWSEDPTQQSELN